MRSKPLVAVIFITVAAFVVGTAVALPLTATAESPRLLPYSGHLDQAGTPVSGTRSLQLSIVDAADAALWTSAARDVTFVDGAFAMVMGESPDPAIPDAVFSTEEIYVTVSVEGTPLVGRQRLYSQPYAIRATSAYEASVGGPLDARLDGIDVTADGLALTIGSGWAVNNTNYMNAQPQPGLVADVGTARLFTSTGSGDYRWDGTTTCDNGRILTIGNAGNGFITVNHNGCGGHPAPCAPFLTSTGAGIGMNGSSAAPANFVCMTGRWWQM